MRCPFLRTEGVKRLAITADSKKVAIFKGPVAAHSSRTFRYDLRKDGTIERIFNRIYSGPVGLLKIYPRLVSQGEVYENMLKFADMNAAHLNGDDDRDEYDLTMPFERGNYIEVVVENEGDYTYDLNMSMTLDFMGGKRRVV